MSKNRIAVVAPGRGSYTKETMGYLKRNSSGIRQWIQQMDDARKSMSLPTLTELDQAEIFKTQLHTKGEHASALIYACALADFHRIDLDKNEIVAITGNSMGWYIALVLAGVLDPMQGFELIQTMGAMMSGGLVGGQVIYPVVDESWQIDSSQRDNVMAIVKKLNTMEGVEVYISIELGGYLVFGANKQGVTELLKALPKNGDFPFQLINHGAFHTPLLKQVSEKAFQLLRPEMFRPPTRPLVDGRGKIWQPYSTDPLEIYRYTLGHQVLEPYHFTNAVSVALKEFVPDQLWLLGPGNSLGGSIGQILVNLRWKTITGKLEFSETQKSEKPMLVSMGL